MPCLLSDGDEETENHCRPSFATPFPYVLFHTSSSVPPCSAPGPCLHSSLCPLLMFVLPLVPAKEMLGPATTQPKQYQANACYPLLARHHPQTHDQLYQ